MSKVKIIVAVHKKYKMPKEKMYLPLHVGAEGKLNEDGTPLNLGFVKDNTGDNISKLNPYFCELTGLYWAWKNLDADYKGLVHYRRYFCGSKPGKLRHHILKEDELEPMLSKYKVFVPVKRYYVIESLYSHYAHTHDSKHLDITREIISDRYPEYIDSFDRVVKHRSGHMFNMMIMDRELLDEYCTWLFDILFELRNYLKEDEEQLSSFQQRFYGRVSEIIFNVWLDRQITTGRLKKSDIKTLPFIYIEKINWSKKILSFLKAKFLHKKYEGSF